MDARRSPLADPLSLVSQQQPALREAFALGDKVVFRDGERMGASNRQRFGTDRPVPRSNGAIVRPVADARTWMLTLGWRELGLLSVHELPATA